MDRCLQLGIRRLAAMTIQGENQCPHEGTLHHVELIHHVGILRPVVLSRPERIPLLVVPVLRAEGPHTGLRNLDASLVPLQDKEFKWSLIPLLNDADLTLEDGTTHQTNVIIRRATSEGVIHRDIYPLTGATYAVALRLDGGIVLGPVIAHLIIVVVLLTADQPGAYRLTPLAVGHHLLITGVGTVHAHLNAVEAHFRDGAQLAGHEVRDPLAAV